MLATDIETDQVGRHRGQVPTFVALLLVCRDRGNGGDALDPAEIRRSPDHLELIEDSAGRRRPTLDLK